MDQLPTIDVTHGTGPMLIGLLTFLVPLVVRTIMKDIRERKEKAVLMLQQCARQAYNSVQNRVKKGDVIEDKQAAGLESLDRFLVLRRGTPATPEEQEGARLLFDALHGEFCPGGTGAPGTATPSAPQAP